VLYSSQRSDPMGDGSSTPYDSKGKGRAQNGDVLALDLDSAEEGGRSQNGGFMQMQMVEQQVCKTLSGILKG
jgi:syntaxin 5